MWEARAIERDVPPPLRLADGAAGLGEPPESLRDYWRERNTLSMDGLPTGLLEAEELAGHIE